MAEHDIKEICQSCKYFVTSNAVLGVCKRYPHYVNKHETDWCGEFIIETSVVISVELEEAAEGLMNLSVEPKKRGRKPKNAETTSA